MAANYQVRGNQIIQDGEIVYAVCDKAEEALKLLQRAWYLNDVKRQYTTAARLIAQAESLPGFKFTATLSDVTVCTAPVAFSPADAAMLRLCELPGTFVNAVGRYLDCPEEVPTAKLTNGQDYEWVKIFSGYVDSGYSEKDADRLAWLEMQNEHPELLGHRFKP